MHKSPDCERSLDELKKGHGSWRTEIVQEECQCHEIKCLIYVETVSP